MDRARRKLITELRIQAAHLLLDMSAKGVVLPEVLELKIRDAIAGIQQARAAIKFANATKEPSAPSKLTVQAPNAPASTLAALAPIQVAHGIMPIGLGVIGALQTPPLAALLTGGPQDDDS